MAITFIQSGDVENTKIGERKSVRYVFFGAADEGTLEAWMIANAPFPATITHGGETYIYRGSAISGRKGGGVYEVDAEYSAPEKKDGISLDPPQYGFDISPESLTITTALNTTVYGDNIPDRGKNLINGGQGISLPATGGLMQWNITKQFWNSEFTTAYLHGLYRYAMHANNATWGPFEAGEALYIGASGNYDPEATIWTVNFKFAIGVNRSGMTLAGISGIAKKGTEYLEYVWEEQEEESGDGTKIVAAAELLGIKVHKIYEDASFATFLGFDWKGA